MAPLATIPLPTGLLGVAFTGGDEPVVAMVKPDSPIAGMIEPGYKFIAITLGNGVMYEGLNSEELTDLLIEKADDHERYLKVEMLLPEFLRLEGPADFSELVVEDRNSKPTVVGYSPDMKKSGARLGMAVSSLKFGDGSELIGAGADEINDSLADDVVSVELLSPYSDMPAYSRTLPKYQTVEIPSGDCSKLGLMLDGPNAEVTLSGIEAREGLLVESLTHPEGHKYRRLSGKQFMNVIDTTASANSRVLNLVNPYYVTDAGEGIVEVTLPDEELGISVSGTPASIGQTAPESFLSDLGLEGAAVKEIGLMAGPSFYNLPADTVAEILNDTQGISGRKIVVTLAGVEDDGYPGETFRKSEPEPYEEPEPDFEPEPEPYEDPEPEDSGEGLQDPWDEEPAEDGFDEAPEEIMDTPAEDETYGNEDGNLDVVLPASKLKAAFSGTPPELTRMAPDSPLQGYVTEGMKVHTLTLPGGAQYFDMSTTELTNALKASETQEGRVLTFLAENDGNDSDSGDKSYIDVGLPTGKLGVSFKGKEPPASIFKVTETSPLPQEIKGMSVDTLNVDGEEHAQLNAKQVTDLIKSSTDVYGRILRVRDPDSQNFKTISDEVKVTVEPGPIGVSFGQSPTVIKSFKEGSQLKDKVPPGMFLDRVEMEDGYMQSGMTTKEVVGLLGFLHDKSRILVFRSSTLEPSPKSEVFPSELVVEIPTGKLGCSFRGSKVAKVSRLHKDSKLKGLVYISMEVASIEIPGSEPLSGLSAAECAKVLADTKNTEGRILTLVAPSDAESTAGKTSVRF